MKRLHCITGGRGQGLGGPKKDYIIFERSLILKNNNLGDLYWFRLISAYLGSFWLIWAEQGLFRPSYNKKTSIWVICINSDWFGLIWACFDWFGLNRAYLDPILISSHLGKYYNFPGYMRSYDEGPDRGPSRCNKKIKYAPVIYDLTTRALIGARVIVIKKISMPRLYTILRRGPRQGPESLQ